MINNYSTKHALLLFEAHRLFFLHFLKCLLLRLLLLLLILSGLLLLLSSEFSLALDLIQSVSVSLLLLLAVLVETLWFLLDYYFRYFHDLLFFLLGLDLFLFFLFVGLGVGFLCWYLLSSDWRYCFALREWVLFAFDGFGFLFSLIRIRSLKLFSSLVVLSKSIQLLKFSIITVLLFIFFLSRFLYLFDRFQQLFRLPLRLLLFLAARIVRRVFLLQFL